MELAGERREARLRGRQGRLAFAYLVLHRDRPVRRDELIEALWAHEGAPPSDTALAPVLSRLRRAVEPGVLDGRDTLRLVFPEPPWIDVEAIRDLVASARPSTRRRAAAELAEPDLLPQLDAPWLGQPARRRRGAADQGAGDDRPRLQRGGRRAPSARPGRRCCSPVSESLRAALIELLISAGTSPRRCGPTRRSACCCVRSSGRRPGRSWWRCTSGCWRPRRCRRRARRAAGARRRAAAITAALQPAGAGEGGVLAFEGPAGIGKTRLLGVLRERALDGRRGGARRPCGRARARVRLRRRAQLFEAMTATEPPPAGARSVFGEGAAADGLFAVLNALFQYTATLATRRPLVLCIDDLQWSDTSSLRFVAYLARRMPALPGAGRDDDPHRRARLRRAAAGRDRAGPGDRRRPARSR